MYTPIFGYLTGSLLLKGEPEPQIFSVCFRGSPQIQQQLDLCEVATTRLELHLGILQVCRCPSTWDIACCLPSHIHNQLSWKQSSQDSNLHSDTRIQCAKQQLNSLCHNESQQVTSFNVSFIIHT